MRLTASGVCHSDLHAFNGDWTVPLPLVLGHEGAGVVEAVGPDVRDVAPGDHVVLSWFAPCRRCRACAAGPRLAVHRDAGARAPGRGRRRARLSGAGHVRRGDRRAGVGGRRIDPRVPPEVAALIGCSVATGVGAVLNTAGVRPGESAVVLGCGGVGQAIILGLVLAGADRSSPSI